MADSEAQDPAACPVDHKSREAWLEQARAASAAQSQSQSQALPPDHPPTPKGADAQESCPVDHKARDVWMQQARAASETPSSGSRPAQAPSQPQAPSTSWTSSVLSYLPLGGASTTPSSSSHKTPPPDAQAQTSFSLDTGRVVSTIPRSSFMGAAPEGASSHTAANNEQETGADKKSGNWIYPSQKMFFDAMKRKGHDPVSTDMQTIVPIHNAVNEKAWEQIKEWENPYYEKGSRYVWIDRRATLWYLVSRSDLFSSCDGPKLTSFSGLSTKLSPKAKINTWLGYQAPFDRHDWIVDRCGREVEYIIDFYTGRPHGDGRPSFYLDVRPKLNSWEGVKMRTLKGLGIL